MLQVIDYLAKKGYTATERTLRAESANQDVSHLISPSTTPASGPPAYHSVFSTIVKWTGEQLDIYKPELRRLLWPIFVHCYLNLVAGTWIHEKERFFQLGKIFKGEHDDDLQSLERISLPEHTSEDNIAKRYRENSYRISMSDPAYYHLMQYMESQQVKDKNFGALLYPLLVGNHPLDIRHVDRAVDDRYSFASMILKNNLGQDMPDEDEGIPGHQPGNAISSTNPNVGNNLANLKLGKLQMDVDLEGDVRAEVQDLDAQDPPLAGQQSYEQTHELVNIKQEDDEDGPTRTEIPYPTATARDVAMEVQKIRENRDRFKIESRTGGIGPGVSVCFYTFHNTFDSINCLDFSGDHALVAAGTSESYIRVWSLDGKEIPSKDKEGPPANSFRLIGHSGPVYAVSFAPSTTAPPAADETPNTKWLLSSSADSTIRLWNLDMRQQLVVYKGHIGPVWSIKWGPFGHYFVSGGHDKTARIWATDKIRHVRILPGHDSDVDVVAWHPNSAYVFTASNDKTVRMWAMTNGQPVRMFTGHTTCVTALCCSPNGKFLASGDEGGSIILWDLGPGRMLKRMRGHGKGGIWSLSFSAESTVLSSGGADGTVRIWDVHGPAKEPTAVAKLPGEVGKVDGAGPNVVTQTVALSGAAGLKKRGKDAVVSADQISAFPTKSTPVYNVKFTGMNLVLAGGVFLP